MPKPRTLTITNACFGMLRVFNGMCFISGCESARVSSLRRYHRLNMLTAGKARRERNRVRHTNRNHHTHRQSLHFLSRSSKLRLVPVEEKLYVVFHDPHPDCISSIARVRFSRERSAKVASGLEGREWLANPRVEDALSNLELRCGAVIAVQVQYRSAGRRRHRARI
jgi:hypothetical protein